MVWVCDCGLTATNKFEVFNKLKLCGLCGGSMKVSYTLPLSFYTKHASFIDLDEDYLNPKRKAVLNAIRTIQPCSDRMISVYLNQPINRVTARRNELSSCSIPFVIAMDKVLDKDTNRLVTYWVINKIVDVEREIEVRQCV